ncbi:MAG: PAS domain S-box protein [Anaerolineales bacterium]
MIGQPLDILLPARYRGVHHRHIQTFSGSSETTLRMDHRQEIFARHKSGREFVCGASVAKMEQIGERSYLVIVHDLSHRRHVEDALRVQGQIIDQIHDAVVSTDLDGYVTSWNKGAEYLFGYSPQEVMGRHISFAYEEHLHDFLERGIIAPLKAKGRHEAEVRMRKKSGEPFEAHLALSLLRDSRDKVVGMIGYSMDISLRKHVERELKIRARQTAIVASLGQRVLSGETLDVLMEDITHLIADTLQMDFCRILELNQEQMTLKARFAVGGQELLKSQPVVSVLPGSLANYVLNTQKPVVINDWFLEERFEKPASFVDQAIVSSVHLNVRSKGQQFGILEAGRLQTYEFSKDDLHFLQAVANVLSDAIELRREELALQESEEKFRTQYKNIPVPTYSFRKDGDDFILIDLNLAAERLASDRLGQLTGSRASQLYADNPIVLDGMRQCFRQKVNLQHELEFNSLVTGRKGCYQISYVFIPPDLIMLHTEDITQRKNAERQHELLLQAERNARQTAERLRRATAALAGSLDRKRILEILLEHLETMVPMSRATVSLIEENQLIVAAVRGDPHLGPAIGEILPEMSRIRFREILTTHDASIHVWKAVQPAENERRGQAPRSWMGLPILVHDEIRGFLELLSSEREEFERAQAALAQALVHQAAVALENAQLFEQVRINNLQIRKMAREIVSAQEKERKRIARDLHDDAGQSLIALIINLNLIRTDLPENLTVEKQSLTEAAEMAKSTMRKLRLLTHDLRPPELDSLGLNSVLKDMCLSLEQQTHLGIEYRGAEISQLPEIVTISLYRILQEALTNVVKHARATRIRVSLEAGEEALMLSIEDDGRGFNPGAVSTGRKGGIGLIGIRERLELIGGQLEIVTQPGSGTQLIARIPWRELR